MNRVLLFIAVVLFLLAFVFVLIKQDRQWIEGATVLGLAVGFGAFLAPSELHR